MLDLRIDQASGLRRSMSWRRTPVIALVGAGEHPQLAGRFARALAEGRTALTLVGDFDGVLAPRRPVDPDGAPWSDGSRRDADAWRRRAHGTDRDGLVLFAVDDEWLARGPSLPACEALVLARADTEGLASAYTRIKVLVGRAEVGEVCTLFGPGGPPARRGHERLDRMARRFLGVGLAFGGAAPNAAGSGAWRRLADGVAEWAFSSKGGAAWRPH